MIHRKSWLLLTAAASLTLQVGAKDFPWPGRGVISIDIPPGWSLSGQPFENKAYTFKGAPDSPTAAMIQITFISAFPGGASSEADGQKLFSMMLAPVAAGSVEKVPTPNPLTLKQGFGWYAQFTNASLVGKMPKPNDYKIMRSALVFLDPKLTATATMQFDSLTQPEAAAMLKLVSSFQYTPGGVEKISGSRPTATDPIKHDKIVTVTPKVAPAGAPAFSAIRLTKLSGQYVITSPQSKVLLRISERGLEPANPNLGGDTSRPTYFELLRATSSLVVSGWLAPADRYDGVKKIVAEIRDTSVKRGLPEPQNLTVLTQDGWEIVAYDSPLENDPKSNMANLRAQKVQSGTWIDLHLFSTTDEPAAAARKKLLAVLATLQVDDKMKLNR